MHNIFCFNLYLNFNSTGFLLKQCLISFWVLILNNNMKLFFAKLPLHNIYQIFILFSNWIIWIWNIDMFNCKWPPNINLKLLRPSYVLRSSFTCNFITITTWYAVLVWSVMEMVHAILEYYNSDNFNLNFTTKETILLTVEF